MVKQHGRYAAAHYLLRWWVYVVLVVLQDFLMKEFEHPIDYDLDAALPRLKTWGLVRENNQVGCCTPRPLCV